MRCITSFFVLYVYVAQQLVIILIIFFYIQLLGILCMALATPYGATSTELFLTVVILAFIFTLLWVAAYYLGVREVLNLAVNWILTVNIPLNNFEYPIRKRALSLLVAK